MRLSESLTDAATGFEQLAADDTRHQAPESAETARAIAAHLRRLAHNHETAATYQRRPALDPEQCEPAEEPQS